MSPTQEPQLTHSLLGSYQALHFAMAQAERKAALTVWNTEPKRQSAVIACILEALQTFSDAVEKCESAPVVDEGGQGGGGQGPACRPGFHEEFGICVPDN